MSMYNDPEYSPLLPDHAVCGIDYEPHEVEYAYLCSLGHGAVVVLATGHHAAADRAAVKSTARTVRTRSGARGAPPGDGTIDQGSKRPARGRAPDRRSKRRPADPDLHAAGPVRRQPLPHPLRGGAGSPIRV